MSRAAPDLAIRLTAAPGAISLAALLRAVADALDERDYVDPDPAPVQKITALREQSDLDPDVARQIVARHVDHVMTEQASELIAADMRALAGAHVSDG